MFKRYVYNIVSIVISFTLILNITILNTSANDINDINDSNSSIAINSLEELPLKTPEIVYQDNEKGDVISSKETNLTQESLDSSSIISNIPKQESESKDIKSNSQTLDTSSQLQQSSSLNSSSQQEETQSDAIDANTSSQLEESISQIEETSSQLIDINSNTADSQSQDEELIKSRSFTKAQEIIYPFTIGGIQVNSNNIDSFTTEGSISYSNDTILLNSATLTGGLHFTGNLNLSLVGNNTIVGTDIAGIKVDGALNISGDGNLNVRGTHGIDAVGFNITLNGTGTINTEGTYQNPAHIYNPELSILFYASGNHGHGISGSIIINSGTLNAISTYGDAVNGALIANNQAKVLASSTYGVACTTSATTNGNAQITARSVHNIAVKGAVTVSGGFISALTSNGPYALASTHTACDNAKMDYGDNVETATLEQVHTGNAQMQQSKYVKIYCSQGSPETPTYSLLVNKSVSPSNVIEGNPVTFTVSITNKSSVEVSNAEVTDTVFNKIIDKSSVEVKLGDKTLTNPANYTWDGNKLIIKSMKVDDVVTVVYDHIYTTGESPLNTVVATIPNPADPNTPLGEGDDSVTTTVTPKNYELEVQKSVSSAPVIAGNSITYTVTVENKGNVNAQNIEINDIVFPSIIDKSTINVKYENISLNNPTHFTWGKENNDTLIIKSLAVGEIITIEYDFTYQDGGDKKNTVTATIPNPAKPDTPLAEDTDSVTKPVTEKNYELSVLKSVSNETAFVGEPIRYFVTIENIGNVQADNIRIADTVFPDVTNLIVKLGETQLASPSDYYWDNNVLIIKSIQPNQIIRVQYDYTHTVSGTDIKNKVTVTIQNPADPSNPLEEKESETSKDVLEKPQLYVSKIADKDVAYIGQTINYTVKVQNTGVVDIDNVQIKDSAFISITEKDNIVLKLEKDILDNNTDYVWNELGDTVTINTIPAKQEIIITYSVKASTAGVYENKVNVTADNPSDPDTPLTPEEVIVETNIYGKPSIELTKKTDGGITNVLENIPINYILEVNNNGEVNLTNIIVNDSSFKAITHKASVIVKKGDIMLTAGSDYKWENDTLVLFAINKSEIYTINYSITPTTIGDYKNVATITVQDPSDPSKDLTDEKEVITEVLKSPSISIVKTSNLATAVVNSPIRYTITVKNTGGYSLLNVKVSDTVFNFINKDDVSLKNGITTLDINEDYSWNENSLNINLLKANETVVITYSYSHNTAERFTNIANVEVDNPLTSEKLTDKDDITVNVVTSLPTPTPAPQEPAPATPTPTPVVLPVIPDVEEPEETETPAPTPTPEATQTVQPNQTNQPENTNPTPTPPTAEVNPEGGIDVDTQLPDEEPEDVLIDEEPLDENLYEFEEGVLTILPEAFEELGDGEHEVEIVYENGESIITNVITDQGVPLSAGVVNPSWSLFDLIMTITAFVLMILYILSKPKKEKEDDEEQYQDEDEEEKIKKRKFAQLMTLIISFISLLFLLITQDFTLPMTIFDKYSIAFAIISIIQLCIVLMYKKSEKEDKQTQYYKA